TEADATFLAGVHVARFATDIGFVHFHVPVDLASVLGLQRETQARQHEPRGFLGYAKGARQFVAADAVLAVGEQPEGREPLLQTDGGVFEDGPDLEGELRAGMLRVALVAPLSLQIGDVVGPAGRAGYRAVGPPDSFDGLAAIAVIRKEQNRFAEGLGCAV